MPPLPSCMNRGNLRFKNSEHGCYFPMPQPTFSAKFSYLTNLIFIKLAIPMHGSFDNQLRSEFPMMVFASPYFFRMGYAGMYFWKLVSSFGFSVINILLMSANEQMIWIATRRIVASVTHLQGIRYLSKVNYPHDAMGQQHFVSDANSAVSGPCFIAFPSPAPVFVIDNKMGVKPPRLNFGWFDNRKECWDSFYSIIHRFIVNFVSGFSELHTSTIRVFNLASCRI